MSMKRRVIIASSCCVVLALYIKTLSPSIAGGDSGEIVAEGCGLGTAHPPGYPLITVIIWCLSRLVAYSGNVITVAYCINAFCAVCTVVAAFLMGLIVDSMSSEPCFGSVLSIGMFSFSPLIWQYAVTAEVFPLNTMFAALILYLTRKFSTTRNITFALIGAFVCGLALCNQHTIVLFEAPLVLWMLILLRKRLYQEPKLFVSLSVCFIVGLLPYLYLPIAAALAPVAGSWGHVTTFSGLLHHILRKDYGTFQLFSGASGKNAEGFWKRTSAYVTDITESQGLYLAPFLAIVGIIFSIYCGMQLMERSRPTSAAASAAKKSVTPVKSNKHKNSAPVKVETIAPPPVMDVIDLINSNECNWTPLVFLLTQVFYFGVFHSLANLPLGDKLLYGIHQRFWMQPNVLLFIWVGVGFDGLVAIIISTLESVVGSKKAEGAARSSSVGLVVSALSLVVAVVLVYLQYSTWLPKVDYSDNVHFRNYATAILSPLPPNAVLFVNYDQQWTSVRYMQQCENFRSDVTSIQLSMMTYKWFQHKRHLYPHLKFPGTYHASANSPLITLEGAFPLVSFLDSNIDKHNIFIGGKLNYVDDQLTSRYDMVPVGLVSQFIPLSNVPNGTEYMTTTIESWNKVMTALPRLPDVEKYSEDTWEWTIGRDFKDRVSDTAAYSLQTAITTSSVDPQPLVNAVYFLESSYNFEGEAAPTALLKNVGLAHVHLIQNSLLSKKDDPRRHINNLQLPSVDYFKSLEAIEWPYKDSEDWKLWCSNHFVKYWGMFLKRPDSKLDPQYGTIKQMYDTATKKSK